MRNDCMLKFGWLLFLVIIITGGFRMNQSTKDKLTGAWHWQENDREATVTFIDDYFTCAVFDKTNKQFFYTWGGPYAVKNKSLQVKVEYHTDKNDKIGKTVSIPVTIDGDALKADFTGSAVTWQQTDEGNGDLAGTWRITGRMQNGEIRPMSSSGSRKTLKILSGTRFQWVAINPATKEFFGTGGGSYTFEDEKYTEHIEFFSRDNSRVGSSLSFDGKITDGKWEHSGLSSRGDPIHEIWSRITE